MSALVRDRPLTPVSWFLAAALGACGGEPVVEPPPSGPPALERVVGGLSRPILVTAPPGDTQRLFVVEQTGLIRVVRDDTLLTVPFLDLTTAIVCCGEQGLLGLAFHPRYAQTGFLYVNYTDTGGTTRVVRYTVSADPDVADAASAFPILSQAQPYANHNGGMLAFGPDGYLYIGLGDGGSGGDPDGNGQDLGTWLGKMLRLDVDGGSPYAIPPTNPYAGSTTARPEIWASGLRNPWRYSFDRLTGDLYIGDVGQNASEEVDFQPADSRGGENYGWNIMEGTVCYQAGCSSTGLALPVLSYPNPDDGCAVTGGYVYRGRSAPALTGAYVYADYCGGWVRSFRLVSGQATDHQDWIALRPGGQISSFGEDGRGEVYVVKYGNTSGAIYRIVEAP
jgi:glucose/arabinose dehydrogenase